MLISKTKQTTFNEVLNKNLADVKSRILNSSVRLKGNNKKSDVDASAAMLCYNGNTTFLVSAKHNLEIYAEGGRRPRPHDFGPQRESTSREDT